MSKPKTHKRMNITLPFDTVRWLRANPGKISRQIDNAVKAKMNEGLAIKNCERKYNLKLTRGDLK